MHRIVISPCCNPRLGAEQALSAYSSIGYRQFEVFTRWADSAFDISQSASYYLELGRKYDMRYYSLHLPPVTDEEDSLLQAVQAARFAEALGVEIVLFKAKTREQYIRYAGPFLDSIAEAGLSVTPVLQNHRGSAISTLQDFREVIEGIADQRMKTLLEVGHFHSVGVSWREGCELLGDSIALVHIKDQIGALSVPFGQGEIDLPGLFLHLQSAGYQGKYVVEMEVADRENTLLYLQEAFTYLQEHGFRL